MYRPGRCGYSTRLPTMRVAAHPAETSFDWGKVVARFNDGRIVRGYTKDFDPSRAHLHVLSDLRDGKSTIILLSDLKALFFVRDFAGDPIRLDDKFFSQTPNGDRIEVTFWTTRSCSDRRRAMETRAGGSSFNRLIPGRTISVCSSLRRACRTCASSRQSGNTRSVRKADAD